MSSADQETLDRINEDEKRNAFIENRIEEIKAITDVKKRNTEIDKFKKELKAHQMGPIQISNLLIWEKLEEPNSIDQIVTDEEMRQESLIEAQKEAEKADGSARKWKTAEEKANLLKVQKATAREANGRGAAAAVEEAEEESEEESYDEKWLAARKKFSGPSSFYKPIGGRRRNRRTRGGRRRRSNRRHKMKTKNKRKGGRRRHRKSRKSRKYKRR